MAKLQTPVLNHNIIVQSELSSSSCNLVYATLSPVPPSLPDSNAVFTQIMEQKSGPIFAANEFTSDECRDTTEWLPPNNYKSIISSSISDDLHKPSCSRIIPNEQIMEQKSGPIFPDNEFTSDESRDTTEWLPPNNDKSIISSSISDDLHKPSCSRIIPNETDFSMNNTVSDRIIFENNNRMDPFRQINESNINSELEEALEVGTGGLRLPRKTNIRELNKIEKAKGIGKKVQVNPCANKRCQNKCKNKFSEEDRQEIFTEFWTSCDPVRQKIIY
ncbi:unnamed protein product [Macrosiphum euphorbiae]|nr:unnamed protein product [Macrosiphum euphorbiae]